MVRKSVILAALVVICGCASRAYYMAPPMHDAGTYYPGEVTVTICRAENYAAELGREEPCIVLDSVWMIDTRDGQIIIDRAGADQRRYPVSRYTMEVR